MGFGELGELGGLAVQTARVFGWFCLFAAAMLAAVIIIKARVKVPGYISRKMLHGIAFGMSAPIVFLSESWQASVGCLAVIMLLAFIVLTAVSRLPWYSGFFVEKERGEVRTSMILLLTMQAIVISVLWGGWNEPAYAVTAIYMWGMGDAFAAIIGYRLGKHRIAWKIADNKKTFEGSAACFAASFVTGAAIMLICCGKSAALCIGGAFAAALVCAFVEMICRRGTDTFFVPLAVTAVLLLLG